MNEELNNKKYDRYTLGHSPAAIYLIDVLNNTTNTKDHNVLKHINHFKTNFKELVNAYEAGHVSHQVVLSYIKGQRLEVEQYSQDNIARGYTPLVINITKNLLVADMKHFIRITTKQKKIEFSAIQRAKNLLKNGGQSRVNSRLVTYGKSSRHSKEHIPTEVVFNQFGLPKVELDKKAIVDDITNESLMEKSIARLTRLGKNPY